MKVKTLALDAVFLVLAMALSYLETLLPLSFGVPGIKAGLPNLVILFLLYRKDLKSAAAVSALRVLLTAVLFGNLFSLAYSLSGAVLSLALMAMLKRSGRFSCVAVSAAGGVTHNLGQILMAVLILGTSRIVWYLPALIISGTLSGLLIGLIAGILIKRVPRRVAE